MNAALASPRRAYDQVRFTRCMAQGLCFRCSHPKGEQRSKLWYCLSCYLKRQAYKDKWTKDDDMEPRDTTYAGDMRCHDQKCGKIFHSPDRRRITRCKPCQAKLFRIEDTLACDEARYDVNDSGWSDIYRKLAKPVGKMSTANLVNITKEQQQDDYRGIPFKRFSQAEIQAMYPPDRVAVILEQARANRVSGWVPDERSL